MRFVTAKHYLRIDYKPKSPDRRPRYTQHSTEPRPPPPGAPERSRGAATFKRARAEHDGPQRAGPELPAHVERGHLRRRLCAPDDARRPASKTDEVFFGRNRAASGRRPRPDAGENARHTSKRRYIFVDWDEDVEEPEATGRAVPFFYAPRGVGMRLNISATFWRIFERPDRRGVARRSLTSGSRRSIN